jgi:hypothetical protein
VRVRAEGPSAVGDDLGRRGQLADAALQFLQWDRSGAVDVPGLELLLRAHVDQNYFTPAQPCDQLLAADLLDLVAEVRMSRALDLGELRGRGIAEPEPDSKRLLTGDRVPRSTRPAPWRACRCWEALATDWSLRRASSSTPRGAWESSSSSSRRFGLARALPINAIASKTAPFVPFPSISAIQ